MNVKVDIISYSEILSSINFFGGVAEWADVPHP